MLGLAALVTAAPFTACGSRAGACPGFDSCSDATTCPLVRCICDNGSQSFPAKCGSDGTCFTASDCSALCGTRQGKCAKPPAACDSYLVNECQCNSTKLRDAEAWNCVDATQPAINGQDCQNACGTTSSGTGVGGAAAGVGGGLGAGGNPTTAIAGSTGAFF